MEEQRVHRPEEILSCCGLGKTGGSQRMGVDLGQREVSEHEAHRSVFRLDLLDVAKRLQRIGALVVAVIEDDGAFTSAP